MSAADCGLILFAKAPVPGRVKTRLIPALGAAGSARLCRQLILHTLEKAVEAHVGLINLWCSPSSNHPFFHRCAEKFEINLMDQTRGNLGTRMAYAFRKTLKTVSQAILIGTDCPALTLRDLREAAACLQQGMDAVIGPAEDGGYVLIGLARPAPELFVGIRWGTGSVLDENRARLQRRGWKWRELPERWDVDRPEDLRRLKREGFLKEAC